MTTYRIPENVMEVLRGAEIDGNVVRIHQKLERKLYEGVNKVLANAGGKWTSGKTQGHVFKEDPRPLIEAMTGTGETICRRRRDRFIAAQHGGHFYAAEPNWFERLPEGTFKESGTMVNSVLVVARKEK